MTVSNDLVADNRVHKIASTLSEEGYEITLVGRRLSYSQDLPHNIYNTKRFRLWFNKGSLFYANLNLRLFFYLLFAKADVFTANDLDTLLAVYVAAKIRSKPLVYDTHEYFTEVPELAHRPKVKKAWEQIEKMIFPRLKNAMTVCKSIAEIYENKYNVPLSVVRNVPNLVSKKPKSSDVLEISKPIILYQGAVNYGRGLELMIEAMKQIDFAHLLVIGGGNKLDELKELATKSGLNSKITFLGRIHFSELPKYTQQAKIGISIEENIGLNYYYALPNKLFDYIQNNIPVLVSDLPEMKRIVQDYECGEIVTNRSPQAIAMQIENMILNPELHKYYVEKTKSAAKDLCWENEKQILINVYNNI